MGTGIALQYIYNQLLNGFFASETQENLVFSYMCCQLCHLVTLLLVTAVREAAQETDDLTFLIPMG